MELVPKDLLTQSHSSLLRYCSFPCRSIQSSTLTPGLSILIRNMKKLDKMTFKLS